MYYDSGENYVSTGANNHRYFVGYLMMILVISILYVVGTVEYWEKACHDRCYSRTKGDVDVFSSKIRIDVP